MRIAIMGTGGLGGFFGGLLARAGEDVTFIARGAHLAAMRERGLTVKSEIFGEFTVPARATSEPTEVGPVDLVLLGVKTYDLDAAVEQMRPLVGPDTMVLPLQNGVDAPDRIARVVGERPVLAGLTYIGSNIESPGVISQKYSSGTLIQLGELDGSRSERTERLLSTLEGAGISAEVLSDIRVALWQKYLTVCANGGVTALTRLPIGPILACPETKALYRGVMDEVASVGRAEGVPLPEDSVDRSMAIVEKFAPWGRASMANDLANGRRLELETLNGTVVRLGRKHDVPTPFNVVIYAALKPYASGAPELPTPP
jgi:2-dehydropantoate 2-reductase